MPYPASHRTPELHRKVSFQFTKKELRIVESWTGFASDNQTIKRTPLNVQTPIKFVWPQDAEIASTPPFQNSATVTQDPAR